MIAIFFAKPSTRLHDQTVQRPDFEHLNHTYYVCSITAAGANGVLFIYNQPSLQECVGVIISNT